MAIKVLDIVIDAKDAASPAFDTVAGRLTVLRAKANDAAAGFGELRKFISGAGLLAAFLGAAKVIEGAGVALQKLRAGLSDGTLTLEAWASETLRSIPILGQFTKAFDEVRYAITGEKAALDELNKSLERRATLLQRLDAEMAKRQRSPEAEFAERRRTVGADLPPAQTPEEEALRQNTINLRLARIAEDEAKARQKVRDDQAAAEDAAARAYLDRLKTQEELSQRVADARESIRRNEAAATIAAAQGLTRDLLVLEEERRAALLEIERRFQGELAVLREDATAAAIKAFEARKQAAISAAKQETEVRPEKSNRAEADAIRQQMAALQGGSAGPSAVASAALSRNFRDLAATRAEDTANKQLEEQRRLREEFARLADRLAVLERVAVL